MRRDSNGLAACFRVGGTSHVLSGLSGRSLLYGRRELAGRLLERGVACPWVSPAEWDGLLAGAFPAIAGADLEVEVLRRQPGAVDVLFRGADREVQLTLPGPDLGRQAHVRSLLAERLLFVRRVRGAEWWGLVHGLRLPDEELAARLLHLVRTAPRHALSGGAFDASACARLESGEAVEAGGSIHLARGTLLAALRGELPRLDPHRLAGLARSLGGRSRRLGPRSRRVHTWAFPASVLGSHSAEASSPAEAGAVQAGVSTDAVNVGRVDTGAKSPKAREIRGSAPAGSRGHDRVARPPRDPNEAKPVPARGGTR